MIGIQEDGESFCLSFKGRPLLRHSLRRPCLGIGRGEGRIETEHGMYKIRGEGLLSWSEARAFTLRTAAADHVSVDFPGLAGLEARVEAGRLVLRLKAVDAAANRLAIRLLTRAEESLYGCGEQFSHARLNGRRFPLWVSEPGVGRGNNYVKVLADLHSGRGGSPTHSYFPQPSFVSSGGLWCLAEASSYAVFDFRHREAAELSFWQLPEALVIGLEPDWASALADFTDLLGRQSPLPAWAYEGIWLGLQGGRKVVEGKLERALAAGLRVGALWCQDWQGIRMTPYGKQLFWNWECDEDLYPDPRGFIEGLHARGIRFLGYNNPFLAADAPQYAEALSRGYFVRDAEGSAYLTTTTTFPVSLLDLSNPDARAWIKAIIQRNMLGLGLDGWMADFGEYLPTEGRLASGEDPFLAHNLYPVEWARVNREAIEEAGAEGSALFFCRSGYTGSTRQAPLFWAGDQLVDFLPDAGLPTLVVAGVSAAMSGVGNWHFDIGGFLSVAWIRRSRELLLRSAELAAFTQVMRSHEGINPPVNAQFDSDPGILAHFARMTRVHSALRPYHEACAAEYAASGLPPIRPLSLHYGPDSEGRGAERRRPDRYLYGRDLLVAPVLRRGLRSRRLDLPRDDWVHLWSGKVYGGGPARVDAPFGEPPVFWRANSPFAALFREIAAVAASGGVVS